MTRQARPVGPDDGTEMGRMLLGASLREVPAWHRGEVPGDAGTLILDGDEPVGGMMVASEHVLLNGRSAVSMPVLVGGVRTGEGYETALACRVALAEHWRTGQAAVVFKWGMTRDFFSELFGYRALLLGWEVLIPPGSPVPPPPRVRPAVPADLPALAALYARRIQAHSGPVLRSETAWQEDYWPFFTSGSSRRLLVHEGPGGIDGYLAVRLGGETGSPTLVAVEWLDDSPLAWRSLWQALRAMAGDHLPIRLPPLPPDRPWDALWPETRIARPIRSLLFRPGRPEHFWPVVACLPGEGELSFSIVDPFKLWPDKLRITWADGRVRAWEPVAKADLHLEAGTLGALALGYLDVAAAVFARRLHGDADALARLATVFAPASLYRYPADFRVHKRRLLH